MRLSLWDFIFSAFLSRLEAGFRFQNLFYGIKARALRLLMISIFAGNLSYFRSSARLVIEKKNSKAFSLSNHPRCSSSNLRFGGSIVSKARLEPIWTRTTFNFLRKYFCFRHIVSSKQGNAKLGETLAYCGGKVDLSPLKNRTNERVCKSSFSLHVAFTRWFPTSVFPPVCLLTPAQLI